MPGIIYHIEIVQALGLNENARTATVEKALRERGLQFEYGLNGKLFAMRDLWNAKYSGHMAERPDDEPIRLVKR